MSIGHIQYLALRKRENPIPFYNIVFNQNGIKRFVGNSSIKNDKVELYITQTFGCLSSNLKSYDYKFKGFIFS